MIAIYQRDSQTLNTSPETALKLLESAFKTNSLSQKQKQLALKFLLETPPSERNETWALSVESFLKTTSTPN